MLEAMFAALAHPDFYISMTARPNHRVWVKDVAPYVDDDGYDRERYLFVSEPCATAREAFNDFIVWTTAQRLGNNLFNKEKTYEELQEMFPDAYN